MSFWLYTAGWPFGRRRIPRALAKTDLLLCLEDVDDDDKDADNLDRRLRRLLHDRLVCIERSTEPTSSPGTICFRRRRLTDDSRTNGWTLPRDIDRDRSNAPARCRFTGLSCRSRVLRDRDNVLAVRFVSTFRLERSFWMMTTLCTLHWSFSRHIVTMVCSPSRGLYLISISCWSSSCFIA